MICMSYLSYFIHRIASYLSNSVVIDFFNFFLSKCLLIADRRTLKAHAGPCLTENLHNSKTVQNVLTNLLQISLWYGPLHRAMAFEVFFFYRCCIYQIISVWVYLLFDSCNSQLLAKIISQYRLIDVHYHHNGHTQYQVHPKKQFFDQLWPFFHDATTKMELQRMLDV